MSRLIIAAATILLLASCGTDPELSDADYVLELVAESEYAGMDPLTSRGGGGKVGSPQPEGWYREKTGEGDREITLWNDPSTGVCTLTVQRTLQGTLNIDVIHDGEWNPGEKSISDIRTRHMILERSGGSTDPHGGWQVRAITVGEHALASGAPASQEVEVESMRLYRNGEQIWYADDREAFFDVNTALPEVQEGDLLRLEAELSHLNPVEDPPFLAYVHGPCPVWQRHPMNDDGLYGDRVAGDGIHSYEWYAENVERNHFVAADVLDMDTMDDQTEENYDSSAWGIHFSK